MLYKAYMGGNQINLTRLDTVSITWMTDLVKEAQEADLVEQDMEAWYSFFVKKVDGMDWMSFLAVAPIYYATDRRAFDFFLDERTHRWPDVMWAHLFAAFVTRIRELNKDKDSNDGPNDEPDA